MFSVLTKDSASPDEMAINYVEVMGFRNELRSQYDQVYNRVMDLQLRDMANNDVEKELSKAKSDLMDLGQKIDSCSVYLERVKEKMAATIPDFYRGRVEALRNEYGNLSKERKEKFNEFLKMAAECLVMLENIDGLKFNYKSAMGIMDANPKLVVDQSELLHDDFHFFRKQVDIERQARGEGKSIKENMETLSKEIAKINKSLEDFDPETEIRKLLENAGYKPQQVKIDPPIAEDHAKTTAYVNDYDKHPLISNY